MSSSTVVCSNTACRDYKSERWTKGWRLRNGDYAHLCDRCASAFQEGKFCDTFHSNVAGWRSCGICLKPVHCGCIMSAHTFSLLDNGGIHCILCEKNTTILAQNSACSPSLYSPISFPQLLKDPFQHWNPNAGTGSVGPLWQATHVPTYSAHTKVQTSRICLDHHFVGFNQEETQRLCRRNGMPIIVPDHSTVSQLSLASAPCSDTENLTRASLTQQYLIPPTGNPLNPTSNNILDVSCKTPVNPKVHADISSNHRPLFPRNSPIVPDPELHQVYGDIKSVTTPLFEKMLSASDAGRVGRLVLPKKCAETYFPPISDPEGLPLRFQDVKGQEWTFQFRFWLTNNSRMYALEGIAPCIQAMELQAGDIVTFSRLEPDGKLIMGYRKNAAIPTCNWADNVDPVNLRKIDKSGFVAKGVFVGKSSFSKTNKAVVGSESKRMKLDKDLEELKITLEEAQGLLRPRIDNMPKIIPIEDFEFEEYEDAPAIGRPSFITNGSVGHSSEDVQWVQCDRCCKWRRIPPHIIPPLGWTCSDNAWDLERSLCIASQELSTGQLETLLSTYSANRKKHKVWKPHPDAKEASDGSQAATMTNRPSSTPNEELSNHQLLHLYMSTKKDGSKRPNDTELDSACADSSDGICKLYTSGLMGESESVSTSAQVTSSKHPRHRPGCSCIVCIQPSSGKGLKHVPTCTCNVCVMLRRRFQTMVSRREKKKPGKGPETAQPNQTLNSFHSSDEAEPPVTDLSGIIDLVCRTALIEGSDNDKLKKPSASPTKGHFDLNIQPEREEELSPHSDPVSIINKLDDGMEEKGKNVSEVVNLDQLKMSNVICPSV